MMTGPGKRYDGYESYDYLEPGVDYPEFELVEERNAFEPYEVELDADEERRVDEIVSENVTIAPHEHPHLHPTDMGDVAEYVREQRIWTGYEWLSQTHLWNLVECMSPMPTDCGVE